MNSRKLRVTLLLLAAFAASLPMTACAASRPPAEPRRRTELQLGTVCTITFIDGGDEAAFDAVFARLAEIHARMSAQEPGSELTRIADAAGKAPVAVSADTFAVIEQALRYAELSGGAFDPTVGPLVRLWGIGGDGERIPSRAELAANLALIDRKSVVLDRAKLTVFLAKAGMRLDLGAIAKGYAADEAARIMLERGVRAGIVDLGGNIMTVGRKPDGSPWRVGVQNPFSDRGEYLGIVSSEAKTVVTSGVYERFFEEGGRRYHHILSTRDGYPVDNGLWAVSIIADRSIDADGLSTSVFALGLEKGRALVESLPGVEAVFIDAEKRIHLSSGASKLFTLTDTSFTLAD